MHFAFEKTLTHHQITTWFKNTKNILKSDHLFTIPVSLTRYTSYHFLCPSPFRRPPFPHATNNGHIHHPMHSAQNWHPFCIKPMCDLPHGQSKPCRATSQPPCPSSPMNQGSIFTPNRGQPRDGKPRVRRIKDRRSAGLPASQAERGSHEVSPCHHHPGQCPAHFNRHCRGPSSGHDRQRIGTHNRASGHRCDHLQPIPRQPVHHQSSSAPLPAFRFRPPILRKILQ